MLLHYKNITLDKVLDDSELSRKTKIICTIGPSSNKVETLVELIDAGMTIARLNFSHGDHKSHMSTIENVRAAVKQRPGCHVAIMLDTKGPEIRTGFLEDPDNTFLEKDSEVEIVTDYEFKGNSKSFACSYPNLATTVTVGDRILAADGSLAMQVVATNPDEKSVVVKMLNSGKLGERKNMNLPGNKVDIPTITEKDANDLFTFAMDIDFVAVSFVQDGSDAELVRRALRGDKEGSTRGDHMKLIAKIENQEGLHNYDSILEEFDAIMVARGDLGMEIPMQKVFLAQKMLIRKANLAGKPVITATQMLESMTSNPLPTRAESTDVANAVLDGTDAVMLSGETASGDHPVASVQILSSICKEAENVLNHEKLYQAMVNSNKLESASRVARDTDVSLKQLETMCSSAVKSQIDHDAALLLIMSDNPSCARLVAKYRPPTRVLVVTYNDIMARQVSGLNWACSVLQVDKGQTSEQIYTQAIEFARKFGWVNEGQNIVTLKRINTNGKYKHLMEINEA